MNRVYLNVKRTAGHKRASRAPAGMRQLLFGKMDPTRVADGHVPPRDVDDWLRSGEDDDSLLRRARTEGRL